jgi:hypothetical protein
MIPKFLLIFLQRGPIGEWRHDDSRRKVLLSSAKDTKVKGTGIYDYRKQIKQNLRLLRRRKRQILFSKISFEN